MELWKSKLISQFATSRRLLNKMSNKRKLTLDDPPQLCGRSYDSQKFIYIQWKKLFEIYVKSKSLGMWRIIEFGDYVPRKDGIPKPESEWSEEDEAKVSENYLAIRLLHSVILDDDFEIVFFCNTAHDIWTALGILHQGNYPLNKLKDSKINHYTQLFETFKVSEYDDYEIDGMYNHEIDGKYADDFKRIINCLKALGKTYTNEVYVERFLSALPYKWNVKVKAIRKNENLSLLSLDELFSDLRNYEETLLEGTL